MESIKSVHKKIVDKIYQTKPIQEAYNTQNRKFISPVWNTFQAIIDNETEIVKDYVCCKYCKFVFKSCRKEQGTSNLHRHVNVCKAKSIKRRSIGNDKRK